MSAGQGGEGGEIEIESDDYEALANAKSGITNINGDIIAHGGESFNASSYGAEGGGGDVYITGYNALTFRNIDISGGDDRAADGGTTGFGGYGPDVEFYSELGSITGGTVDLSGGNGEYRGATVGDGYFWAPKMAFTLIYNGGDADPGLAGSEGGDLNFLEVWSQYGQNGVTGMKVEANPGTGTTPGVYSDAIIVGAACTGPSC